LLSDFGLKDPYLAEMKAVISTINPEARIIDISHLIEKYNVRMGAFVLASASRYFPKGTIHVGVVDPGVGTKRRALLVETEHAFYIGPDNGLLMLAAQSDKIRHVYAMTNTRLMLPHISFTFHGRDVFAPAAAHLTNETPPADFGREIKDYIIPTFAAPVQKDRELTGEVLHMDDFGNIITNITSKNLKKIEAKRQKFLTVRLKNKMLKIRFCKAYGDVTVKDTLALIGSHDFLEIAVNQGNASKKLKTKAGDILTISLER
jgi:S-adenosylmethionine hydrolase